MRTAVSSFRIMHSPCDQHILQMSDFLRHVLCVVVCANHGERPRYQEATGSPGDYAIRIDACCDSLLDQVAQMLNRTWRTTPAAPTPSH
jgi:hypothetical protein